MHPNARPPAFLPQLPLTRVDKPSKNNSSTPLASRPRRLTMAAPLPDDTALDMLSFALSGPGILAAGAFAAGGLAIVFSFADIGPRRSSQNQTYYFLRLTTDRPVVVELSDGSARSLPSGESVLRMQSYEQCTAVARQIDASVSYAIFRAAADSMVLLAKHPRPIDAPNSVWPTNVVQAEDNDLEARWEEYQRLGQTQSDKDLSSEWNKLVGDLSPIQFTSSSQDTSVCRLCSGTGYIRCHRCGGACALERVPSNFQCDCDRGRRTCEWCNQTRTDL